MAENLIEIQHKTKKTLYDQAVPNLVELQLKSYEWFKKEGLKELLEFFSPIQNYDQSYSLAFIGDPIFEEPTTSEEECRNEMKTYEAPIKVKVQFIRSENGNVDVREEDVFLAELPIMTENGTFFINGAERVVVSQLSRSPGAYFENNFDTSGNLNFIAKILPTNGSWIEMFTDGNELKAHIASSSKFPITLLLRSMNKIEEACPVLVDSLLGEKLTFDIIDMKGELMYKPVSNIKSKSKKASKLEVDILTEEHIKALKEEFGDYIYTNKINQVHTTEDILNTFGYKAFKKISKLYFIENYKVNSEDASNVSETVKIELPLSSSNKKLNEAFRVLHIDLYNRDNKLLFAKGTSFDDKKLLIDFPIFEKQKSKEKSADKYVPIKIGKNTYSPKECIEYLILKGETAEYKKAISNIECEKVNILLAYLDINAKKISYNVIDLRPVNDIVNEETGEVLCGKLEPISFEVAKALYETSNNVYLEYYNVPELISNTIKSEGDDKDKSQKITVVDDETALNAFHKAVRKNEPPNLTAAINVVRSYFFDNKKYDIGKVGRYKLNRKLGLNIPEKSQLHNCRTRSITKLDLIKFIKYTIFLSKEGKIVNEFFDTYKNQVIEKMEEYVSLVKKNKILGIKSIEIAEETNKDAEQSLPTVEVKPIFEKFSTIEKDILDGRLAFYDRMITLVKEMELGYLLSKEDYYKLNAFLEDVAKKLDPEKDGENLPFVKYALSDSPNNLDRDYVMARINPCIIDEIDHLENKRVRSIGELLQDQLRVGFQRLEKLAKERMNANDKEKLAINALISTKPISTAINSFFGTHQLSQFMDQTNPLAELTHKRRLSALGPGGLTRQSAKLEVRDVHHSHYGRICPIETPEGPNIGLIGSMAIHARINDYGFLETPYRVVKDSIVTDEIKYLSAEAESHEYIATADAKYDEETKKILAKDIVVRHNGKYPKVNTNKITLMEISPNQIMSVAANLIPFIENDDANRALMGSNMQRQAVPLLKPSAPIVRTGTEFRAAHDSGVERFAKRDGKVVWVSCENICILPEEPTYRYEYTITYNVKKKYDTRDSIFSCSIRKFSYDDVDKKNQIGEEEIIPVNSILSNSGKPVNILIDDVKHILIDSADILDRTKEVLLEKDENIAVNDLVFNKKVYELKTKTSKKYTLKSENLECLNGIVKNIEYLISEDIDETPKMKLTIAPCDIYCLTPTLARNAFPADYTIIRFGNINIKSKTAGVGSGVNNKINLEEIDENVWKFDVVECDNVRLINMVRSNQGTCINSRAVVKIGSRVRAGELLSDGPCTDHGELALGQNLTVAFVPWNGYNYEDAILLNEKLVKNDTLSSIHIEKYETEARDTKLGPEEITRDIPNTGDDKLRNLDKNGIIKIGAQVTTDSILVGKISPKGQKEAEPEDRLLKQIFGNKAEEKRDVSLRVPHGQNGTVVDVKVFSRFKYQCENLDCANKINSCKKLENGSVCPICGAPLKALDPDEVNAGVNQLVRVYIAQKRKIMKGDKMAGRHGNKGVISNILNEEDMPFKPDGTPVDIVLNPLGVPSRMNIGQILETHQGYAGKHLGLKFKNPIFQSSTEKEIITDLEIMVTKKLIDELLDYLKDLEIDVKVNDISIKRALNKSIELVKESTSDELDHVCDPLNKLKADIYAQALEEIKSYDAYDLEILSKNLCTAPVINDFSDETLSLIDEIEALNHEKFKAINSEDSLYEEGNAIDDLDTINEKIDNLKSKSFDIPKDYNYQAMLDNIEKVIIKRVGFKAKLAKTDLYDGITGDKMMQPVCVGTMYMLKLHHLVADKMHARATGPYSLVTQQPLGGKAQFGGQRFGEMEVWALEAYGAAHTLQEILTIKSDDVIGRVETYESIVKGLPIPIAGLPESFKILVNELQALCLKITVRDEKSNAFDIRTYDDTPLKA